MTSYYVSAAGSDLHAGTSPAQAWKTIGHVNAQAFLPGDAVLFRAGDTFNDATLNITWSGGGGFNLPILFGSYGAGPATLAFTGNDAVFCRDQSMITVDNLTVAGPGGGTAHNGVEFFSSAAATTWRTGITVSRVTATGWANGIIAGGVLAGGGYSGLVISGCTATGNNMAGIATYGISSATQYSNANVTIANCVASDNLGNSLVTTTATGYGILCGSVFGGTISGCVTAGNGALNAFAGGGPVGCMVYQSDSVTVTGHVAYSNGSGTSADGDGIDLDIHCFGCIVEYSISYGNAGAGILLFAASADPTWGSNTARYNICWGNATQNADAEIYLDGTMAGAAVYCNTLIATTANPVIRVQNTGIKTNIAFYNNILAATGAGNVITEATAFAPSAVYFLGNLYCSASAFQIASGATNYASMAAWRTATLNEQYTGGVYGYQQAPAVAGSLTSAPAVTSPADLSPAYGLRPAPALAALTGVPLPLVVAGGGGSRDFFGSFVVAPAGIGAAVPVPFPAAALDFTTELNLGGAWTDVTEFVNMGHGSIPVSRGHPDESTQTPASTSALSLANTDFRFVSLNPTGPYYPNLGRNTPVRVSLAGQAPALRMEDDTLSAASMPAAGVLPSGATDLEVRIDLALSGWSPCVLASWWAGFDRAWILLLNADGTVSFAWTTDGTMGTLATATSTAPLPLGPVTLRVTFTHVVNVVTFFTAPAGDITLSSWTQLGAAAGTGSGTVIFASTAPFAVGFSAAAQTDFGVAGLTGRVGDVLVMAGIGGGISARAAFSSQAPGISSWADGQGNAWSLSGSAAIDRRSYRFHGEAAGWPQKWDPTAHDVRVDVSVSGLIRRLGQRNKTAVSPMRGAVASRPGSLAPVAYWPMEDGPKSSSFLSGLPGGAPMRVRGTPSFAGDSSSFASSAPLPVIDGASWSGQVPGYTGSGVIVVRFLFVPGSLSGGGSLYSLIRVDTTGDYGSVYVSYASGSGYVIQSSNGTYGAMSGFANVTGPVMVSAEITTSGGNVTSVVRVLSASGVITSSSSMTPLITPAVGRVTGVMVNPFLDNAQTWASAANSTIGHLFAQSAFEPLSDFAAPLAAYAGEAAGTRFARVCAESGVRARIWGYPSLSAPMGAQPIDTLMNVLQQCADTDRGVIYEPSECLGLGYRTLASLCNQAPALTIGYGQLAAQDASTAMGETEDDLNTINDATVSNPDGSSAEQILATGPMSVLEPGQGGAGTVDQEIQVNTASDSQLSDIAGWILNTGTVNQPRYPAVKIDLATSDPSILALWWQVLALRLGDRVVITTPPGMLPPGNIDQLMQQLAESIYTKVLNFDLAMVPSLPYSTALYDDPAYGRPDTDGSQLHAGIGTSDTSMLVDTVGPSGIVWTVGIGPNGQPTGDFPLSVVMGGEVVTVADIAGPPGNFLSGQTATFDGGTGTWVAQGNTAIAPVTSPVYAGTGAMRWTSAAAGSMQAAHCTSGNIATQGVPCSPGDVIVMSAWFLAATAGRTVNMGAQFYTSGGVSIANVNDTARQAPDTATAWAKIEGRVTAPATAAFCRLFPIVQGAGGAGEQHYVDLAYVANLTTGNALRQTFQGLTRSANGITKAHQAGEDIRLYPAPVYALL